MTKKNTFIYYSIIASLVSINSLYASEISDPQDSSTSPYSASHTTELQQPSQLNEQFTSLSITDHTPPNSPNFSLWRFLKKDPTFDFIKTDIEKIEEHLSPLTNEKIIQIKKCLPIFTLCINLITRNSLNTHFITDSERETFCINPLNINTLFEQDKNDLYECLSLTLEDITKEQFVTRLSYSGIRCEEVNQLLRKIETIYPEAIQSLKTKISRPTACPQERRRSIDAGGGSPLFRMTSRRGSLSSPSPLSRCSNNEREVPPLSLEDYYFPSVEESIE